MMANAAKEINEYTKRLDLINKYRVESDQSLQGRMQRVSLHSVYKRSSRFTTLISEMLGIMVQASLYYLFTKYC
ncbi:Dynamin-binding protein [Portunus trituberculatus]|uniref:Dynamin-binding protein n=1 Tax=Portunus trituberculatus TaxID=210409 RepID=A0A5B7JNK0_PORTR|nr:Dynamin-binding protein [Portunus trituberculatus]